MRGNSSNNMAVAKNTLPQGDFSALRPTGKARVIEILSPLTLKLDDGRIVHLAGLDYPDLSYHEGGTFSATALHILKDFLEGQSVVIYQTPKKDEGRMNSMGHAIAHLARAQDDVWVQGLVLKLGLARVRTTTYNAQMATQMLALEDHARTQNAGIWREDSEYAIINATTTDDIPDGYHIVTGRVRSIASVKNMLYINFGDNWRDDFTVAIQQKDMRKFMKANLNPKQLNGRNVRVRGWVRRYNGAYMEIDHPQRIEVLSTQNAPPQHGKSAPAPNPNSSTYNN